MWSTDANEGDSDFDSLRKGCGLGASETKHTFNINDFRTHWFGNVGISGLVAKRKGSSTAFRLYSDHSFLPHASIVGNNADGWDMGRNRQKCCEGVLSLPQWIDRVTLRKCSATRFHSRTEIPLISRNK